MLETLIIPPLWMGLPFIATLFLMALAPYAFPRLWHSYESAVLIVLGTLTIAGLILTIGKQSTIVELIHVCFQDYLPFVILLSSLYVVTSGLQINLNMQATPLNNTIFLGFGTILASFIGTTGASMVLLRPFMEVNQNREKQTHSIIFFIFLISNIGGSLTPIGDPPLFLGYLNGVDFFWTLQKLLKPFIVTTVFLLIVYYKIDSYFYKNSVIQDNFENKLSFSLQGKLNFIFIAFIIGLIITPGLLQRCNSLEFLISLGGQEFNGIQILCSFGLIILSFVSYVVTPKKTRHHQHFSWKPVIEVAKVFAIIFITIIPLNLMLKAGANGPLGSVLSLTQQSSSPAFLYFWLTGIFSAFLDNAPTYLLFFKMAGGDAYTLMNKDALILMAISLASVFMGAITYIGNAPNFMVRTLAKQHGVEMPGFLGYMVWSIAILFPLFLGISLWLF